MTHRNNNRKQPHTGSSKVRTSDTEFGSESTVSKKASKRAAKEE
ncbi:hypothetical protein [Neobacillus fumarioli]|nr:hypothetical protein [Neobacillus fumarioli]